MAKRKAAKKAKKAKKPAKLKGPQPGPPPPRTGWYLSDVQETSMDSGTFQSITIYDENDEPIATVYGDDRAEAVKFAQAAFKALAPKRK